MSVVETSDNTSNTSNNEKVVAKTKLKMRKENEVRVTKECEGEKGEREERVTREMTVTDSKKRKRKKSVSPGILRISEIFEKTEKEKVEKRKKGENVGKMRSRFEEMMGATEVRKTKFEMKTRSRKTPIFNEEKSSTTTRRNTLMEWAGEGVGGQLQSENAKLLFEKGKTEKGTKLTDRLESVKENGSSGSSYGGSCSNTSDRQSVKSKLVKDAIQTGQNVSKVQKVEDQCPKSRQRKGAAFANNIILKSYKTDKSDKILQKEDVFGQKVKIWNRFVENGQGYKKSDPVVQNGPLLEEKLVGTNEEGRTKPNQKKTSNIFKGGQSGDQEKGRKTGKHVFVQ